MKKRRPIRFVLCVIFASLQVACSENYANNTSTGTGTTPASAAAGPVIDNEDMTAGLMGVDADKNGIRDDIDRLIALRYALTPAMKRASEQEARALQQSMQATTKAQSILAGNEIRRAGRCSFKIFPRVTEQDSKFRQTMSKEIEALTANTKERFIGYWKSESLGSGVVYRQPEEPVCD